MPNVSNTQTPLNLRRSAVDAPEKNTIIPFEAKQQKGKPRTAKQRENGKTLRERGEDLVYIINHAAACTTLDTLNTPIEMLTQHYLHNPVRISQCACCDGEEHPTTTQVVDKGHFATRAGKWLIAEYVGDWLGAIPTLLVQRHAPQVMEGIGQAMTYVAGDFFYAGAQKDAKHWGREHGFAADSDEVKGRTKEIYSHEMKHIAQAFVWTGFSTGITLTTLRALGDKTPIPINLVSKIAGTSTSFFGVLGARAAFPDKARHWDSWASEHVATPMTKIISKTLGIEDRVVNNVLQQQQDYHQGAQWLK